MENKSKLVDPTWHDGILRYVRIAWIPVVILVLILVIRGLDRRDQKEETETAALPVTEETAETTAAPDPEQLQRESLAAVAAQSEFQHDAVPELTQLVRAYLTARTECDPAALAGVFGTEETEEEAEVEKAAMELVKASIKSYENISCYHTQGLHEGEYVIFPYYEIRYRKSDILVPELTYGYVRTGADGQLVMAEELSQEEAAYVDALCQKQEILQVIRLVQARQEEAIASDEALAWIYSKGVGSEVVVGEKKDS